MYLQLIYWQAIRTVSQLTNKQFRLLPIGSVRKYILGVKYFHYYFYNLGKYFLLTVKKTDE